MNGGNIGGEKKPREQWKHPCVSSALKNEFYANYLIISKYKCN
jgi:hypothetical protein